MLCSIQNVRILLTIIYMCSLLIDSALTGFWFRILREGPVSVRAIESTFTVTEFIVGSTKSVQP